MSRTEEARERFDLQEQFAAWGLSARGLQVRCPHLDHEDQVASARLYPKDRKWWCFGCNRGGDIADAVAAREGTDVSGALRSLLGDAPLGETPQAGLLPGGPTPRGGTTKARETPIASSGASPLGEAPRLLARWAHQMLLSDPDSGHARSYLRDRGYDRPTLERWQIGHVPRLAILPPHIRIDHLTLPLWSPGGTLAGIAGWNPAGHPKYRLPGGYVKGLYGFHYAAERLIETNDPYLVLVEGYNDVHMLDRDGFAVMGLLGGRLMDAHFTHLHLLAYQTGMRWLVLFMDGDDAGAAHQLKNIEAIRERIGWAGIVAVDTPRGRDPGDLYAEETWDMGLHLRQVDTPSPNGPPKL